MSFNDSCFQLDTGIHCYQVGGAVRDKLLNLPVTEIDWVVVGATPQWMVEQGFKPVGSQFPVFLHPKSKEEYALARTERKVGYGYAGFECYADTDVTLEQDLIRRDITINAMAKDCNGNIIDPYHGGEDLQAKRIRHVSDTFSEDPLRVLRVARFYARFADKGFTIDEQTMVFMEQLAESGELTYLSVERIWMETYRAMSSHSPWCYFEALNSCNALSQVMQPLANHIEMVIKLLKKAVDLDNPMQRYAMVLAYCLPQEVINVDSFCSEQKLPNMLKIHVKKLIKGQTKLLLVAKASDTICQAKALVDFYNAIDAWRQSDTVEALVQQSLILFDVNDNNKVPQNVLNQQVLTDCFHQARGVTAQAFIKNGVAGAAIAAAIYKKRVKMVTEILNLDFAVER